MTRFDAPIDPRQHWFGNRFRACDGLLRDPPEAILISSSVRQMRFARLQDIVQEL
jgi:hypothetical protein